MSPAFRARCSHQHPTRRALICDLPAGHHGDHARTMPTNQAWRETRISWTTDGATWQDRT